MNPLLDMAALQREADQLDQVCGGDERLFGDMMEGSSSIDTVIMRLHNIACDADGMAAAVGERIKAIQERKARYERRRDGAKDFIGKALRIARLAKLELPEVTYSVRDGKPSLEVVDVSAVPEEYLTYKPIPNKTQINADFDPAGDLPNWLVVREGGDVVTGRTK